MEANALTHLIHQMEWKQRKGSFNEYKAFDDLVMKKSSSHLSIPDEGKHPRSFSHSASYDTMPKPDESNNGISKLKKLGNSNLALVYILF